MESRLVLDPLRYVQVIYFKNDFFSSRSKSELSWVRLRGPVIQAIGRLTFEDDLRAGGLLYFPTQVTSVRTELADTMVTPGEPGGE